MSIDRDRVANTILAMNAIMRSLNDEDLICWWLSDGVPDGTATLEDVRELYINGYSDDEINDEFESLSALFAKIIQSAVKSGYEKYLSIY